MVYGSICVNVGPYGSPDVKKTSGQSGKHISIQRNPDGVGPNGGVAIKTKL